MRHKGKFRCVGVTDTGRVREHNEDTFGTDADIGLVVLADGMGGYKAGEVASGITVRTVMGLVKEAVDREDLSHRDEESGLGRPGILLRDAIQRANKIIHQTAKTQANCEGMGTTVVAGLFFDDKTHDRPRRRFTAVPDARRPAAAGDPGPLAAAGTGLPRVLHARRGRARLRQELRHPRPRRRTRRSKSRSPRPRC